MISREVMVKWTMFYTTIYTQSPYSAKNVLDAVAVLRLLFQRAKHKKNGPSPLSAGRVWAGSWEVIRKVRVRTHAMGLCISSPGAESSRAMGEATLCFPVELRKPGCYRNTSIFCWLAKLPAVRRYTYTPAATGWPKSLCPSQRTRCAPGAASASTKVRTLWPMAL